MKPGFAILPLEVWADIVEHQLITRQMMARIADNNGDPGFTAKLQKLLHECGKHSLRYLDIDSKQSDKSTKEPKIPECRAVLAVSNGFYSSRECGFPETGMPENIKTFKRLSIGYLDDEVLDFLNKIKPLFTNVYLIIRSLKPQSADNMHIWFTHLLPMLASIRGIRSDNGCLELLERKFPGALAQAKELELFEEPASIPICLNWLSAPHDFDVHGPRLMCAFADSETIFAIVDAVDAVRKQFLAATTSSAFVIFFEFTWVGEYSSEEFKLENATTQEELAVRNAVFKDYWGYHHPYVEIVRHPRGAEAKVREWIDKRAYFEKKYNNEHGDKNNKEVSIWVPTIGHITKQAEDKLANVRDDDADGPSTSAKGK